MKKYKIVTIVLIGIVELLISYSFGALAGELVAISYMFVGLMINCLLISVQVMIWTRQEEEQKTFYELSDRADVQFIVTSKNVLLYVGGRYNGRFSYNGKETIREYEDNYYFGPWKVQKDKVFISYWDDNTDTYPLKLEKNLDRFQLQKFTVL